MELFEITIQRSIKSQLAKSEGLIENIQFSIKRMLLNRSAMRLVLKKYPKIMELIVRLLKGERKRELKGSLAVEGKFRCFFNLF